MAFLVSAGLDDITLLFYRNTLALSLSLIPLSHDDLSLSTWLLPYIASGHHSLYLNSRFHLVISLITIAYLTLPKMTMKIWTVSFLMEAARAVHNASGFAISTRGLSLPLGK